MRLHRNGMAQFPALSATEAWLVRVMVNLCLDRIRKQARWRDQPLLFDQPSPTVSVEKALLQAERLRLVEDAVASLPERERAALVLREVEGLSTAETAEALGSSQATVRSQVASGFRRLRQLLGGGPGISGAARNSPKEEQR